MNLVDRAKNILLTPKTEWEVIKGETATPSSMYTGYVLPLSFLPAAVALLSGILWVGVRDGIFMMIAALLTGAVAYFIGIYVTDGLAPSFNSTKNINSSSQLVGYSYTANAAASVLGFIPGIGLIAALAGFIYTAYLMYLGVGPVKNTPDDKKAIYVVVIILVEFLIGLVISAIITASFITRNRVIMSY
jgi:Yip1-like protein